MFWLWRFAHRDSPAHHLSSPQTGDSRLHHVDDGDGRLACFSLARTYPMGAGRNAPDRRVHRYPHRGLRPQVPADLDHQDRHRLGHVPVCASVSLSRADQFEGKHTDPARRRTDQRPAAGQYRRIRSPHRHLRYGPFVGQEHLPNHTALLLLLPGDLHGGHQCLAGPHHAHQCCLGRSGDRSGLHHVQHRHPPEKPDQRHPIPLRDAGHYHVGQHHQPGTRLSRGGAAEALDTYHLAPACRVSTRGSVLCLDFESHVQFTGPTR